MKKIALLLVVFMLASLVLTACDDVEHDWRDDEPGRSAKWLAGGAGGTGRTALGHEEEMGFHHEGKMGFRRQENHRPAAAIQVRIEVRRPRPPLAEPLLGPTCVHYFIPHVNSGYLHPNLQAKNNM